MNTRRNRRVESSYLWRVRFWAWESEAEGCYFFITIFQNCLTSKFLCAWLRGKKIKTFTFASKFSSNRCGMNRGSKDSYLYHHWASAGKLTREGAEQGRSCASPTVTVRNVAEAKKWGDWEEALIILWIFGLSQFCGHQLPSGWETVFLDQKMSNYWLGRCLFTIWDLGRGVGSWEQLVWINSDI